MNRQWWSLTALVAGREFRERTAARSYRISTVLLVLVVVCAVGIPALVHGSASATKVGVVGPDPQALAATVHRSGTVLGQHVRTITCPSLARGRAGLRSGDLAVLYVGGREVLIDQKSATGASDSKARLAAAIAQLATSRPAAAAPSALPVRALKPPPTSLTTRLTGLAVVVLIYLLVFVYGQRITSGVVEEKSSRAIELLLASVRPLQLLTGKVIGMGLTALLQVGALVAAFFVVAAATGSGVLHGAAIGVVAVGAIWLVLGYALHCTAFAAAGSLITRESDAANVTFPVLIPLLLSYALSFGVIFGNSASSFYHVLAFIPPTAPVASTTLYATGAIGVAQVAIAAAICLVSTVVIARLAGRVYEYSVLRTGARVPLREALRAHSG